MLTVINGPMFAGKTSRLISLAFANVIAGKNVVGFKPSNDTRHSKSNGLIITHDKHQFPAHILNKDAPDRCFDVIFKITPRPDVIIFDEAQFFDVKKFETLIERMIYAWGYEVICAGLSQDSEGRIFGPMPYLLAVADNIINLKAVCAECKTLHAATRTFRKDGSTEQVAVGGAELYEPRCFGCWEEDK